MGSTANRDQVDGSWALATFGRSTSGSEAANRTTRPPFAHSTHTSGMHVLVATAERAAATAMRLAKDPCGILKPQQRRCDTVGCLTDVCTDLNTSSPFTASAARSGNLLAVHVHHGEHLDALLLAHDDSGGDSDLAISSFVVASVGPFCTAPERYIQCFTTSNNSSRSINAAATATEGNGEEEPTTLYEQRYSPFTATRVVENSSSPAWNELLALSLPFEKDSQLVLRLELVQRGPSQQEDFLLATAIIPLLQVVECERRQVRLALQFPRVSAVAAAGGNAAPRIFVSLRETTRDCFKSAQLAAADRLEMLVQRFVPIEATTSSEVNGKPASFGSLALAVAISPLSHELAHDLTQLFTVGSHQSQVPSQENHPLSTNCGLTPSSVVRNRNAVPAPAGVAASNASFQWHFPLAFELPGPQSGDDVESRTVDVALYDTSDALRQVRIGSASIPLTQLLHQAEGNAINPENAKVGQSFALSPPLAIHAIAPPHDNIVEQDAPVGKRALIGHLHASIRCWSAAAWTKFLRETPSRRVVSSNRSIRKTHALLGLEWMGALLRGLNRYPVSSFCDEGGLSSVLVGFLAASSQPPGQVSAADTSATNGGTDAAKGLSAEASALLNAQVAQLQAETAAQKSQIERLQVELELRLKAVQTCGKELVALRRELRLKDQRVEETKAELEKVVARERLQMEQLSASSAPFSGVADSRVHQQLTLVLTKYKDLERQYQETRAELDAAKRSLELFQDLEARHAELEQAHLVQAAQVQRLRREKQQVAELKRAVRLQEKVIRQFEDAVSLESAEELTKRTVARSSPAVSSTDRSSRVSNGDSGVRLQELGRLSEDDSEHCGGALLAVRVRVLEEQLTTNAREAASEIGRLKMRILELEANRHS